MHILFAYSRIYLFHFNLCFNNVVKHLGILGMSRMLCIAQLPV